MIEVKEHQIIPKLEVIVVEGDSPTETYIGIGDGDSTVDFITVEPEKANDFIEEFKALVQKYNVANNERG